jgi:hypothetical protein
VWPAELAIARPANAYTLLLIAHPHCPCTRATFEELDEVVSRSGGRVRAPVIFVQPRGVDSAWVETALLERARRMPGVATLIDHEGRIAARLHVFTSGQALLYDPAGRLVYSGGLTGARGHVGRNRGMDAVLASVFTHSGASSAPVVVAPLLSITVSLTVNVPADEY